MRDSRPRLNLLIHDKPHGVYPGVGAHLQGGLGRLVSPIDLSVMIETVYYIVPYFRQGWERGRGQGAGGEGGGEEGGLCGK